MKNNMYMMLAIVAGIAAPQAAMAQTIGPSTTTEPYLLPSISGVSTTSVLTTGDTIGGYRMVGVPDGLGLFYDSIATTGPNFNVVMHHELGSTSGVARAHASKGAFVSRWQLEKSTLKVLAGRDQIASGKLMLWNGSGYTAGTTAFDRFCSADMASYTAFFANGKGTPNRIFLGGEETSPPFANDHGRAMAHVSTGTNTGTSYQLPRLGRFSFENALASPYAQDKTIVMLNDDASVDTGITSNICTTAGQSGCNSPPSEMHMYVGTKQTTGNDIERAGLTNGSLYGMRVKVSGNVVIGENADFVFGSAAPAVTSARFEMVNLGNVENKTGVQIQNDDVANQITQFMRIEDGAWDPRPGKQNDYYFITTGRISTSATTWRPSRLWRMRFDNIANPEAGGTIDMILTNAFYANAAATPDADPSYQMFDNMTIDKLGRIVLLEDVGNNARLGRVYVYGIDTGVVTQVAVHNSKYFSTSGSNFLTIDEEASGVIDATDFLGQGWYMIVVQNHKASADAELVEGGQLLALYINPSIAR